MFKYNVFEELIRERGIKRADVCKATGIKTNVFTDWKSGKSTPKYDKVSKIADYLNVPIETFLGIKKDATKEDSISIINSLFMQLTEENKQLVINMIKSLLGK